MLLQEWTEAERGKDRWSKAADPKCSQVFPQGCYKPIPKHKPEPTLDLILVKCLSISKCLTYSKDEYFKVSVLLRYTLKASTWQLLWQSGNRTCYRTEAVRVNSLHWSCCMPEPQACIHELCLCSKFTGQTKIINHTDLQFLNQIHLRCPPTGVDHQPESQR